MESTRQNASRANFVPCAQQWRWGSLWHRVNGRSEVTLHQWALLPGGTWVDYVNQAETEAELRALRHSVSTDRPLAETVWQHTTAKRLGLQSTLRSPGRPRWSRRA